jgi:hypothetical protein
MAALTHGFRSLCVPGLGRDQAPIAARVAELDLGFALDPDARAPDIARRPRTFSPIPVTGPRHGDSRGAAAGAAARPELPPPLRRCFTGAAETNARASVRRVSAA